MAQTKITATIKWYDIYTEVKKISSYEGRQSVSAAGESDYSNILITSQDEELIKLYILQAITVTEDALSGLVVSTKETTNTYPLTANGNKVEFDFVVDGARASKDMICQMVTEAVSSHVMMLWLSERKSNRVEFYNTLFKQMINSIKTRLTRKSKPSLDITYIS